MAGSSSPSGLGYVRSGHSLPVLGLVVGKHEIEDPAKSDKGARPVSWTRSLGVLAHRFIRDFMTKSRVQDWTQVFKR